MIAARVAMLGVALALTTACSGDSSGPNNNQNGSMTATIDGTAWTSVAATAVRNVTNGSFNVQF